MTTTSSAAPTPAALRERAGGVPAQSPRERNLALAFDRLTDDWENRAAHQAFVYEATQAGELTFAGKLYRAVLDAWPQDEMALAAQKQISTSAMFGGGLSERGGRDKGPDIPRWVFLSGGMSLAWILVDMGTEGTFAWMDLAMVVICLASIGYIIWVVRQR